MNPKSAIPGAIGRIRCDLFSLKHTSWTPGDRNLLILFNQCIFSWPLVCAQSACGWHCAISSWGLWMDLDNPQAQTLTNNHAALPADGGGREYVELGGNGGRRIWACLLVSQASLPGAGAAARRLLPCAWGQDCYLAGSLTRASFGWLVAGADLLWEKNTAGWLVADGWCWNGVREKHCWLAGSQPNKA